MRQKNQIILHKSNTLHKEKVGPQSQYLFKSNDDEDSTTIDFTKRYKETSTNLLFTESEPSRYKNGFMSANIKKENENPFIIFDQKFSQNEGNVQTCANSLQNGNSIQLNIESQFHQSQKIRSNYFGGSQEILKNGTGLAMTSYIPLIKEIQLYPERPADFQKTKYSKQLNSKGRKFKENTNTLTFQLYKIGFLIFQYLIQIIESSQKVESKREILAEIKDFDPYQIFQSILKHNNSNDDFMNLKCIQKFLENNQVKSASEYLLLESDWNKFLSIQLKALNQSHISYSEFLDIILPKQNRSLREKVLRNQNINMESVKQNHAVQINPIIKSKIMFAIAQIFDQSVKMYSELADIRSRLMSQEIQSRVRIDENKLLQIFEIPNGNNLNSQQIANFLYKYKNEQYFQIHQQDIDSIFEYFKGHGNSQPYSQSQTINVKRILQFLNENKVNKILKNFWIDQNENDQIEYCNTDDEKEQQIQKIAQKKIKLNKQKTYLKNLTQTKLGVPKKFLPKCISEIEKKSITQEQEDHMAMLKFNNFLDIENLQNMSLKNRQALIEEYHNKIHLLRRSLGRSLIPNVDKDIKMEIIQKYLPDPSEDSTRYHYKIQSEKNLKKSSKDFNKNLYSESRRSSLLYSKVTQDPRQENTYGSQSDEKQNRSRRSYSIERGRMSSRSKDSRVQNQSQISRKQLSHHENQLNAQVNKQINQNDPSIFRSNYQSYPISENENEIKYTREQLHQIQQQNLFQIQQRAQQSQIAHTVYDNNYNDQKQFGESNKLDKLIKRHFQSENKRKAIFNIIPGASYLQAKEHFSIKNRQLNSARRQEENNFIIDLQNQNNSDDQDQQTNFQSQDKNYYDQSAINYQLQNIQIQPYSIDSTNTQKQNILKRQYESHFKEYQTVKKKKNVKFENSEQPRMTRRKSHYRDDSNFSCKSQEEVDRFNQIRRGHKSEMVGFEEDFFVNLLKTQYQLEKNLETMKIQLLVDCQDFNAIVAFRLFDPPKDRKQNLGPQNVISAFRKCGICINEEIAKLIIKRYDDDRDGMLSFNNVRDIFSPRDSNLANQFKKRVPQDLTKTSEKMDLKTYNYLRSLLQNTLEVEKNIENLKKELQVRPDFDFSKAFDTINRSNPAQNEDCISSNEFKILLKSHGLYTLDLDIKNLFDRFDKNKDGNVTFKDFANEMVTVEQSEQIKRECIYPYRQFTRAQMISLPPNRDIQTQIYNF